MALHSSSSTRTIYAQVRAVFRARDEAVPPTMSLVGHGDDGKKVMMCWATCAIGTKFYCDGAKLFGDR